MLVSALVFTLPYAAAEDIDSNGFEAPVTANDDDVDGWTVSTNEAAAPNVTTEQAHTESRSLKFTTYDNYQKGGLEYQRTYETGQAPMSYYISFWVYPTGVPADEAWGFGLYDYGRTSYIANILYSAENGYWTIWGYNYSSSATDIDCGHILNDQWTMVTIHANQSYGNWEVYVDGEYTNTLNGDMSSNYVRHYWKYTSEEDWYMDDVLISATMPTSGEPLGPDAAFTANPSGGYPPLIVDFTPSDPGLASYTWHFGDGSSSTDVAPTHGYTGPGTYNVTLNVSDGSLYAESWSLVSVYSDPKITSIPTITVSMGSSYHYAPVCNVPVASWSLETNATFLSIDPKTGEITGDIGVDDLGWYALIIRASTSPVCDQAYILWVTELQWNETVKITVKATGLRVTASYALSDPSLYWAVRSVSWSFGDGSLDQSGATATHTYARPGTYTVTCTVTNVLDDLTLGQRNVMVAKASVPLPNGTGSNDTDGGDSRPRGSWIVLLALPMTLAVLVLVWTLSRGKQRRH